VHIEKLRNLARSLSAAEAKVFIALHAVNRQEDGSPQSNGGIALSPDRVGLPKATMHRAILSLVAAGRIEITQPAKGRRPALYRLAPAEAKGVRRKKSTTTCLRR
jgi:DNA-binding MarR family transcriptional regulator